MRAGSKRSPSEARTACTRTPKATASADLGSPTVACIVAFPSFRASLEDTFSFTPGSWLSALKFVRSLPLQ